MFLKIGLFAQADFRDGFIVKQNADTVYGLLDYKGDLMSGQICKFKNNKLSKAEEFTPNDILGYGFVDGKNYVAKTLDFGEDINVLKQKYFIEYLVKGTVNLYYFRNSEKDHYYLESDKYEIKELRTIERIKKDELGRETIVPYKEYLGVLKVYLTDCEAIKPRLENFSIGFDNLIILISDYNKCICSECHVFVKPKPILKSSFGIVGGNVLSNLKTNTDFAYYMKKLNYQTDFDEIIGNFKLSSNFNFYLFYNLVLPRINEKISLEFEAQYCNNKYIGFFENALASSDFILKNKSLKFPVLIKYTYPGKKYRPFMFFGAAYCRNTMLYSEIYRINYPINNIVRTQYFKNFNENNTSVNFIAGAGIKIKLSRKTFFVYEFRAEYGNSCLNFKVLNFNNSIGISF